MQHRPVRPCQPRRILAYLLVATLWYTGCAGQSGGEGGKTGSGGELSSGGATSSGGAGGGGAGGASTQPGDSGGRVAGSGGAGSGGSAGTGDTAPKGSGGSGLGGVAGAAGSVGGGGSGQGGTSTAASGGRTVSAGGGGGGGSVGGAGTGGSGGASTSSLGGSTGACGPSTPNGHPFGCKLAWGVADSGGSLSGLSYAEFVSSWIDSGIDVSGTIATCGGCNWLSSKVASTNLVPVYYAYIIGFYAHANGIVDGNQSGSKKLTTDGAAFIKANYNSIVSAYTWYAKQTAKVWPSKPLVWLLEGDFVQFTDSGQSSPMSFADLGKLAADITCAIKSNMPNAVVAINHSAWNTDAVTKSYWSAMSGANYDMVWTTGVGDANGFIATGTTSSSYNGATATYSYLHGATGRTILVDTSAGASSAGDSWSTAGASQLNARINEGVIAANITGTPPSNLQSNITSLSGLSAIPSCP